MQDHLGNAGISLATIKFHEAHFRFSTPSWRFSVVPLPNRRIVALAAAFFSGFLLPLSGSPICCAGSASHERPNIVVIFIDDMGYADIGPFGAEGYQTPHLDRMAQEGRLFTDFHAGSAVCSASRAALLTGCYPRRVSIEGALKPGDKFGLNPDEITLAEVCKQRGYATAIFGKWHLGDRKEFLPLQQGFDEFFGLPYSNDMWPYHPEMIKSSTGQTKRKFRFPDLPLYDGNRVINAAVTPEDQSQLTTCYTERAINFIERNAKQPFFLYLPHTMVHVPIFVSEKFKGKSERGLYGDVVMELDWSVGQILATLKRLGLDEKTLVVFTSDNGPWLSYGDHAGSAKPLREGKGTMFEGGYREPCIMRMPGTIPARTTCDEFITTMDLLPTIASWIDAPLPKDRIIDGHDIRPLLRGDEGAKTPYEIFYCYYQGELRAVRDGRWKLHLPHSYRTLAGKPGGHDGKPVPYSTSTIGLELFDLNNDVGEMTDVADKHPDVVARLQRYVEGARQDLGDKLTKRKGKNIRPHGKSD